jgi:gas vesicle protein
MASKCSGGVDYGGFLKGMLIGTAIGAGLGMLFAPKAGSELRQDVVGGVGNLGQTAKEAWEDVTSTVSSAVEKGREAYDEEVKAARQGTSSVSRTAGDGKS